MRARSALLAAAATLAGCSESTPTWIRLAEGFEPRPLLESARAWPGTLADGRAPRIALDDEGVWVELDLRREDWSAHPRRPGSYAASRPWDGAFAFTGNGPVRLVVDGVEFSTGVGPEADFARLFYLEGDEIFVNRGPDAPPPKEALFAVRATNGRDEDGIWNVRTLDHEGAGIPVYPGLSEGLEVVVPPASALRFTTVYERLPHALGERDDDDPPTATFRVRAGEDVAFEASELGAAETHTVPLPAGRARLVFEVEGEPGRGVFFAPTIGPAEPGDYGERPWDPASRGRPDLVLFIADTFRADNMETYGGELNLTPELDAFARESLRFLNAHSTAAWTLPSISSMLTGLFPPQHGATRTYLSMPRTLTTLAEELSRFGYRTVAVTDSGFFSPAFGLDQGFELFYENRIHHWHLSKTIDQALSAIDHDDGRPLFLVVHTYRVHGPFRSGPEEDEERFNEFVRENQAMLRDLGKLTNEEKVAALRTYIDEWVAMYHEGVRDFDVKFGRFLRELERRDVLAHGYLLFTGDHGQAHGENDEIGHGGNLWEPKLRIPILLAGHDVEPGDDEALVSLVDFAPTFADLASVPRPPSWPGRSLLETDAERATFSFRLDGQGKEQIAMHSHAMKVCALPDPDLLSRGEITRAYDLVLDPGERHDRSDEPWGRDLARDFADVVEELMVRLAEATRAESDPGMREDLAGIGYAGE